MASHDTTQNKPSTMEHIKDKASNLVHKVAGKLQGHDEHQTTLNSTADPLHHQNLADPRREKREGAAGSYYHNQAPQPLPQQQHHQQSDKHSGPLHTGAALAGDAAPHGITTDRAAYQKLHEQQAGIPSSTAPVTDTHAASGLHHHPAPAGPTGTTNVPTYAQNIPPTAAGVVPRAYEAEQDHGLQRDSAVDKDHLQHQWYKNQAASGLPVNTNNSADPASGQSAPVHSINPATVSNPTVPTNTVPAMGAPGTTTAAGTHIPGEFNSGAKANTATGPFDKPTENRTPFI
ncbi:MAG: hypothetical protein J3Q66DRAFT_323521 [Benniella sp.]|nr:MAG: hypothetical protein J3Q66DRAFT_323521 [Benniella sp.]